MYFEGDQGQMRKWVAVVFRQWANYLGPPIDTTTVFTAFHIIVRMTLPETVHGEIWDM